MCFNPELYFFSQRAAPDTERQLYCSQLIFNQEQFSLLCSAPLPWQTALIGKDRSRGKQIKLSKASGQSASVRRAEERSGAAFQKCCLTLEMKNMQRHLWLVGEGPSRYNRPDARSFTLRETDSFALDPKLILGILDT